MSEWTIDTFKEHVEMLFANRDKAVAMQATEYERRLAELNHAHEQATARNAEFVTTERYDTAHHALQDKLELSAQRSDARLASLENWRSRAAGVGAMAVLLSGAIGALLYRVLGG